MRIEIVIDVTSDSGDGNVGELSKYLTWTRTRTGNKMGGSFKTTFYSRDFTTAKALAEVIKKINKLMPVPT